MATKAARRVEVDTKTNQIVELDYADKSISSFAEIAAICKTTFAYQNGMSQAKFLIYVVQMPTLTSLTLSHNKLTGMLHIPDFLIFIRYDLLFKLYRRESQNLPI